MIFFRQNKFFYLVFILIYFLCDFGHAFIPVGETGEIIKMDKYQVGLEPMLFTESGGRAQFNAFFDFPYNEATSFRTILGTGFTDFVAGATVKYVPFPDIGTQPAIGLRGGVYTGHKDSVSFLAFEATPLFSKKFEYENGPLIPYAAIPIRWISSKTNTLTSQMALGADWYPNEIVDYFFNGELGINLKDSYSYISLAVTLPFDRTQGLHRR